MAVRAPARPPASEGTRTTTLPSGTRVVTEAMPGVRSVAVGFWIGCGSRDEQAPVAGASHFLEHLLFKGTGRRSAQQIAEAIDAVGGDLNAFTSKEYTCFMVRCLDRDLPLAIDVLGDMFTSARIDPADVDAERAVVLEEIHMYLDTPDDLVHSMFSEAYFGEHPLGREVLGSKTTVTEMHRDQVDGYYRRQYVPSNLVVAVAGNVEHDDVVEQVASALEGARVGDPDIARVRPDARPQARTVLCHRPIEQVHMLLGGAGLARSDERRWTANVLNQALGGGMASRLFQEVRERRGLVYSVFSYLGRHADTGTFAVYAGTAAPKVTEVLGVIREEFARLLIDGLTDEELVRAKGFLAGSLVLALEDTGSRMSRLGKAVITDSPLLSLDDMVTAVEAVSVDDVRDVAGHLLTGPFTLSMVGPVAATDGEDFRGYIQPLVA